MKVKSLIKNEGHEEEWNDIRTQQEADELLNKIYYFHDSCIKELKYISGSYVSHDLSMKPIDDIRTVSIIFQRQWKNPSVIEMVFEEIIRLNLVPTKENYTSEILEAYLIVKDGFIYYSQFENDIDQLEKSSNDNTWIKSRQLKWRKAEAYLGNDIIYTNKS